MRFARALMILGGLLFSPVQVDAGEIVIVTQSTIKAFRRLVKDMQLVEAYRLQSKIYEKEFKNPPTDEDEAKFQAFIARTLVAPVPEIETAFIIALAKRLSEEEANALSHILELPGGRKFIASMISGMTVENFDMESVIETKFTSEEKEHVEKLRQNVGFGKYLLISRTTDYMADVVAVLLSSPSFRDLRAGG